jgi:hypothetical protein
MSFRIDLQDRNRSTFYFLLEALDERINRLKRLRLMNLKMPSTSFLLRYSQSIMSKVHQGVKLKRNDNGCGVRKVFCLQG